MVGTAVADCWRRRGAAVLALSREQADVTDRAAVLGWARRFGAEVVINCAAFTRVDDCETQEDLATAVNGTAVGHLAEAAEVCGAALLHVSTDYVFDGSARTPIPEDAPTAPRSAYGRSKLVGEQHALAFERATVLRTSWVFGPGGPNFAATIRRLLAEGRTPLRVVDDQVGRPTSSGSIARALWDLACLHVATGGHGAATHAVPRIVHYGDREPVSWHGFATEIARRLAPHAEVVPVTTDEFPRPAERPAYSVLDVSRFEALAGRPVEPWISGLSTYLDSLVPFAPAPRPALLENRS